MKTTYRYLLPALLSLCFVVGCAPARLAVHIDLYRATEGHRETVSQLNQVRSVQIEVGKLQNNLTALFTHYRVARTNLLEAKIANAKRLPGKADQETAINAQKDNFDKLIKAVGSLEVEFRNQFNELNRKIAEWKGHVQRMQSGETGAAADAEKQRQAVAAVLESIFKKVEAELSRRPKGDRTERRLALAGLREEITSFHNQVVNKNAADSSIVVDLATAGRAVNAAEREQENALPQTQKTLQAVEVYVNPDLLADDSDPFYQVLANPHFKPGWSTNFFVQQVSADGKVSFLIVRETAVRFTVNEAKANPAVLIQTQLRSARAGIKTVAAVAKAVNPALAMVPGTSGGAASSGNGSSKDSSAGSVSVAALRQQEEQIQAQIIKLQEKLVEFEKEINAQRETGRSEEEQALKTEAAAKAETEAAQTVVNQKVAEQKAAKEAFDADTENQTKKTLLESKNTELQEANKTKKSADDKLALAQADLAKKKAAVDKWARQWFNEKVKPVLDGYRGNLSALLGSKESVSAPAPPSAASSNSQ